MHAILKTPGTIVTFTMLAIVGMGCPTDIQAQRINPDFPLDYNGPIYTAQDFWPLAVGNYWLWSNPEDPSGSTSKELIKSQSIKGMDVYLVETIRNVELGTYPSVYYYLVDHPEGLFKTLTKYSPDGPDGGNEDLSEWAADPDDMSTLIPVLTGEFVPGTFPHPTVYDANMKSTVAPLADVTPFDQCEQYVPEVIGGGPEEYMVPPEHLVLLNHGVGACDDGTRTRFAYDRYAYGIGPLTIPRSTAGKLVFAIVDGNTYSI